MNYKKSEDSEYIELPNDIVVVHGNMDEKTIQLSARLAEAAHNRKWDTVKRLLKRGATLEFVVPKMIFGFYLLYFLLYRIRNMKWQQNFAMQAIRRMSCVMLPVCQGRHYGKGRKKFDNPIQGVLFLPTFDFFMPQKH